MIKKLIILLILLCSIVSCKNPNNASAIKAVYLEPKTGRFIQLKKNGRYAAGINKKIIVEGGYHIETDGTLNIFLPGKFIPLTSSVEMTSDRSLITVRDIKKNNIGSLS